MSAPPKQADGDDIRAWLATATPLQAAALRAWLKAGSMSAGAERLGLNFRTFQSRINAARAKSRAPEQA